jgi:hypothetical protein
MIQKFRFYERAEKDFGRQRYAYRFDPGMAPLMQYTFSSEYVSPDPASTGQLNMERNLVAAVETDSTFASESDRGDMPD